MLSQHERCSIRHRTVTAKALDPDDVGAELRERERERERGIDASDDSSRSATTPTIAARASQGGRGLEVMLDHRRKPWHDAKRISRLIYDTDQWTVGFPPHSKVGDGHACYESVGIPESHMSLAMTVHAHPYMFSTYRVTGLTAGLRNTDDTTLVQYRTYVFP